MMKRYRLLYSKKGLIRFTGNLDIQKILGRSLRRANIAIQYSEGFHPQAKIQQASPLPLGFEGDAEITDIWVQYELDDDNISEINQYFPKGLQITSLDEVAIEEKSLQSRVYAVCYSIKLKPDYDFNALVRKINDFRKQDNVPVTRRGKTLNLASMVEKIHAATEGEGIVLSLQLAAKPANTGRPEEVLEYLGIDAAQAIITRTKILYR